MEIIAQQEETESYQIKNLEFKLALNQKEIETVDSWLAAQQHVWNIALSLLDEFETFSGGYNKSEKIYYPCCPIPWDYYWLPIDSGNDWRRSAIVESLHKKDKLRTTYFPKPYSRIGTKRNPASSCPLPRQYIKPQIDKDGEYNLVPWFKFTELHKKQAPGGYQINVELIKLCPYKILQGTIKTLATAWKEYRKGKRKKPRYKGFRNPMKSISDNQSGNAQLKGGDRLKLPKLKHLIKVRSLDKRWESCLSNIRSYTIKKEPSGYYIFLVGRFPLEKHKESTLSVGYDAGIKHLLTDDCGNHIVNPEPLKKLRSKLKKLQKKASRQWETNGKKPTQNWRKTQAKIALVHEKIRRYRKAYAHKISTYAVSKYGSIAVEKLNLAGMMRRPKPKPTEDGQGYEPNRASAKAGLNRALADAGMGQLINMLEEKAKHHERLFVSVNPQYTSQTCSQCGHVDKGNRESQAEFKCLSCGFEINADHNAAINIKRLGMTGK